MPQAIPAALAIGAKAVPALSAIGGGSAAAGAGTLLGAGGSYLSQRQNRKAVEKQNEMAARQREQARQDILKYGNQALEMISPAYGAQRDVIQQQMGTLPGYYERMAVPQFEIAEKTGMNAQNTLLAGLGMQNAALLGQPSFGRLQAKGSGIDPQQMASMATLQPFDTSVIDNILALQGQKIPTSQPQVDQSSLTPEQIQMMREMQMMGNYYG